MADAVERGDKPTLFGAGFGAGLVVTGVLNPVDRALYLSVAKSRPFLDPSNWRRPYQGLAQGLVGRAVSTGLWFPLQALASESVLHSQLPPVLQGAAAGQAAGAANALMLSPLSMVKYQTWGLPEGKRHILRTARKMVRTAGLGVFFRGLSGTVWRDSVFGGVFGCAREPLREEARAHHHTQFAADACAAGVASVASSPFNFARTLQFSQPLCEPALSTRSALGILRAEVAAKGTPRARLHFLVFERLMVGWGTLRVAGGMALASWTFDRLMAASAVVM